MAVFSTIHTNFGLAALAAAEASGTPINLTHMAVGDGAGNPVLPDAAQTALVRETYRATINRVFQSPDQPNKFTAELWVPASEGGFVLREVGVFNAAGSLFAIGNLPDTYKPMASEGAFADTLVRLEFMVSNAESVEVIVDPNVAVVTQEWVQNNVTAEIVIPGGTTHQVLRKATNADGDVEWADAADANVVVNTIEETQTLADAQVIVMLAETSTIGLALYVDGVRLRDDEWTADPSDITKLTLDVSYTAGAMLTAVQNEPAGAFPAPLVQAQNLADVPDKGAARTNLDIYSKTEVDNKGRAPADVFYTAAGVAPTGALKANFAAVSRTVYAKLFAKIGTTYGPGDGATTFNLPEGRGEFIRGWDDGRGIDPARALGSAQAAQLASHDHTATTSPAGGHWHHVAAQGGRSDSTVSASGVVSTDKTSGGDSGYRLVQSTAASATVGRSSTVADHGHNVSIGATGGSENRPRNMALLMCIQYD